MPSLLSYILGEDPAELAVACKKREVNADLQEKLANIDSEIIEAFQRVYPEEDPEELAAKNPKLFRTVKNRLITFYKDSAAEKLKILENLRWTL